MKNDKTLCLQLLLTIVAVVLIVDEAWMLIPGFGYPGWLIGDWSWMHVEPFHHWMLGVAMLVFIWVIWPLWRND